MTRDNGSHNGPLPRISRPFGQTFNSHRWQESNQVTSTSFTDDEEDNQKDFGSPPPASTVPVLPVEATVAYTYPEPFGTAEVKYIFPAGKIFVLEDYQEIGNDDLKPGMKVRLGDGVIGTVSAVQVSYDPPEPPVHLPDGRVISRVVGMITHRGFSFASANRWLAEQLNQKGIPAPEGGEWTVTKVKAFLKKNNLQWHHNEDMTTMQLLNRGLHDNIAHVGGRSLKDFTFTPPLPARKPTN